MIQHFLFGLLLGWGAAIPIGPINIEMIRRNLRFGVLSGVALGCGACSADVTYLALLSLGSLQILTHPVILKIIGILGALMLGLFGWWALQAKKPDQTYTGKHMPHVKLKHHPLERHFIEGYLLTLINPMTLLFWSSVSSTIAIKTLNAAHALFYAGLGVACGTLSWSLSLNTVLQLTRQRLTFNTMHILNKIGGIILLGFAIISLWHVFKIV